MLALSVCTSAGMISRRPEGASERPDHISLCRQPNMMRPKICHAAPFTEVSAICSTCDHRHRPAMRPTPPNFAIMQSGARAVACNSEERKRAASRCAGRASSTARPVLPRGARVARCRPRRARLDDCRTPTVVARSRRRGASGPGRRRDNRIGTIRRSGVMLGGRPTAGIGDRALEPRDSRSCSRAQALALETSCRWHLIESAGANLLMIYRSSSSSTCGRYDSTWLARLSAGDSR